MCSELQGESCWRPYYLPKVLNISGKMCKGWRLSCSLRPEVVARCFSLSGSGGWLSDRKHELFTSLRFQPAQWSLTFQASSLCDFNFGVLWMINRFPAEFRVSVLLSSSGSQSFSDTLKRFISRCTEREKKTTEILTGWGFFVGVEGFRTARASSLGARLPFFTRSCPPTDRVWLLLRLILHSRCDCSLLNTLMAGFPPPEHPTLTPHRFNWVVPHSTDELNVTAAAEALA